MQQNSRCAKASSPKANHHRRHHRRRNRAWNGQLDNGTQGNQISKGNRTCGVMRALETTQTALIDGQEKTRGIREGTCLCTRRTHLQRKGIPSRLKRTRSCLKRTRLQLKSYRADFRIDLSAGPRIGHTKPTATIGNVLIVWQLFLPQKLSVHFAKLLNRLTLGQSSG